MSDTKRAKAHKIRTTLIHSGRDSSEQFGFINTPIYRGSTVLHPDVATLKNRSQRFVYGTHGSPTTESLERVWSEISGAAGTVLVPSGLAAIAIALQAVLKAGDHILVTDGVYWPTRRYCDVILKKFGVETTYYDPMIGGDITKLFKPNTRAVFTEAPSSHTFEVQDIPAIAKAAHARDIVVLCDNTWATPLYFPPHERGADIAIEAGTKYLGGHSDILLGLVTANEKYWPALHEVAECSAYCAGPEDVFLALRGLRTMKLRLDEANRQAFAFATWLKARPEVARVLHPAFPECPGHEIWKRDFSGSSGLFAIVLKPCSDEAVAAMLDGLELFGMGYSWGGFESLVVPSTPPRTVTEWRPEGPVLRIQVGFEDLEDLKADFDAGFKRLNAAR